jgi:hypothetical protein
MVTGMKMAVFWDIAPCSLADIKLCFKGAYCLHQQGNEHSSSTTLHGATSQKTVII